MTIDDNETSDVRLLCHLIKTERETRKDHIKAKLSDLAVNRRRKIMPKGYLIAHVKVNDFSSFTPYKNLAHELVDKYQGRWIVRAPMGGVVLEDANGVAEGSATVVVEFDSFEQAKKYYNSEEYQEAKKLRLSNSESTFVLVEGAA